MNDQDKIKELEDKIKLLESQKKELYSLVIGFCEDEHGVDPEYSKEIYKKYSIVEFNNE